MQFFCNLLLCEQLGRLKSARKSTRVCLRSRFPAWVLGISLLGNSGTGSPLRNFGAGNGILRKTAVRTHGGCLLTFPQHPVRFQCKEPGSAALRGGAWLVQTKGMEDSVPPAPSLEQALGVKRATNRWLFVGWELYAAAIPSITKVSFFAFVSRAS